MCDDEDLSMATCRDCAKCGFGVDGLTYCCANLQYVESVSPDMEACEDFERRDI